MKAERNLARFRMANNGEAAERRNAHYDFIV
jgi:hypothetical protein